MSNELTRRQVNAQLLAAAGFAASAPLIFSKQAVAAQPGLKKKKDKDNKPSTQTKPGQTPAAPVGKSFLDDVLKQARSHDWVLKVSVHLDSYQDQNVYTLPGHPALHPAPQAPGSPRVTPGAPSTNPAGPQPNGNIPQYIPFKFDTAAVVFPALLSTAGSMMPPGDPTGELRADNKVVTMAAPSAIENLQCGARYFRWGMTNIDARQIDFDLDLPVTCWDTVFDEATANKAIWPVSGKWPPVSQSTFASQLGVELGASIIGETINRWCAGKPPNALSPVQLAKFFAARMIEEIQPSGDGLISSRTGLLQGFDLRGPDLTLHERKGSEHDIACTLCALYRNAGLPARVVVGFDLTESKGDEVAFKKRKSGSLRSWVEFCLVDETVTNGPVKEFWIPVDIARQRKHTSSRAPGLEKPWKFFGFNDELRDVIPIAFHYHPPLAGIIAHGSPCFWGWMTTPEMQEAEQTIRFTTSTASKTAEPKQPAPGYK